MRLVLCTGRFKVLNHTNSSLGLTALSEKFGIANKSTAFCSTAQRQNSELRTKVLYFVQAHSENFGIATKSTVFCSAASKNFLELRTKALLFCSRATKILDCEQKHSKSSRTEEIYTVFIQARTEQFGIATKSTAFCSAAQRKLWNSPTKPTQTGCILFCRAAKNLGIYQQKHKITVFCSAVQRKFWNLPTKYLKLNLFCPAVQ
jgi:hypothetical protein